MISFFYQGKRKTQFMSSSGSSTEISTKIVLYPGTEQLNFSFPGKIIPSTYPETQQHVKEKMIVDFSRLNIKK